MVINLSKKATNDLSLFETLLEKLIKNEDNQVLLNKLLTIAVAGKNSNLVKLLLNVTSPVKNQFAEDCTLKVAMSKIMNDTNRQICELVVSNLDDLPKMPSFQQKLAQYALWLENEAWFLSFIGSNPGFPILVNDENNNNLLHYSCRSEKTIKATRLLLNNNSTLIHQKNNFGLSPFMIAVFKGNLDTVTEIYRRGLLTKEYATQLPKVLLHFAVVSGNEEMVKFLLYNCKEIVNLDVTLLGKTALQFANYLQEELIAKVIEQKMLQNIGSKYSGLGSINNDFTFDKVILSPTNLPKPIGHSSNKIEVE